MECRDIVFWMSIMKISLEKENCTRKETDSKLLLALLKFLSCQCKYCPHKSIAYFLFIVFRICNQENLCVYHLLHLFSRKVENTFFIFSY